MPFGVCAFHFAVSAVLASPASVRSGALPGSSPGAAVARRPRGFFGAREQAWGAAAACSACRDPECKPNTAVPFATMDENFPQVQGSHRGLKGVSAFDKSRVYLSNSTESAGGAPYKEDCTIAVADTTNGSVSTLLARNSQQLLD